MLTDPLITTSVADDCEVLGASLTSTLNLIDLAPGKSVRSRRVGGDLYTMTIAHSVSNENKGTVTDRTAVRLDHRKTVEGVGDVTAQATLTHSFPRVGFTMDEIVAISAELIGTLFLSSQEGGGHRIDRALLRRALSGEP